MHRILFALAVLAVGAAAAQPARPDPTDPRAKVPPVEYRSAFDGYKPFAEEKLAPWRESNDAVKGEGAGHAGPMAPPAGSAKPASKPPAGARDGGRR